MFLRIPHRISNGSGVPQSSTLGLPLLWLFRNVNDADGSEIKQQLFQWQVDTNFDELSYTSRFSVLTRPTINRLKIDLEKSDGSKTIYRSGLNMEAWSNNFTESANQNLSANQTGSISKKLFWFLWFQLQFNSSDNRRFHRTSHRPSTPTCALWHNTKFPLFPNRQQMMKVDNLSPTWRCFNFAVGLHKMQYVRTRTHTGAM